MPQSIQKIIGIVAALGLLVSLCTFTVSENELAVRSQFREIIGTGYSAGLHFKLPIDTIRKFERRIVSQSFEGETFLTSENRGLIVDYYVKWRIKDAGRYAQAFGVDTEAAGQRLADIVKDGIKNAVAQRTLVTAHDAFGYFGRRYGLTVRGIQGISTESEPSLGDIEALVTFIADERIPAIFMETTVSDRTVRAVVDGCAAKGHELKIGEALYSDSLGRAGSSEGTWAGMLRHNAKAIADALGGRG